MSVLIGNREPISSAWPRLLQQHRPRRGSFDARGRVWYAHHGGQVADGRCPGLSQVAGRFIVSKNLSQFSPQCVKAQMIARQGMAGDT